MDLAHVTSSTRLSFCGFTQWFSASLLYTCVFIRQVYEIKGWQVDDGGFGDQLIQLLCKVKTEGPQCTSSCTTSSCTPSNAFTPTVSDASLQFGS